MPVYFRRAFMPPFSCRYKLSSLVKNNDHAKVMSRYNSLLEKIEDDIIMRKLAYDNADQLYFK